VRGPSCERSEPSERLSLICFEVAFISRCWFFHRCDSLLHGRGRSPETGEFLLHANTLVQDNFENKLLPSATCGSPPGHRIASDHSVEKIIRTVELLVVFGR
jgi:hypothetical protein